jgi:hypothetical protein
MGATDRDPLPSGSLVWKQWHRLKPAVVCRPEIRWQIHDVVGSQPSVLSSPLCREDLDLGQLIWSVAGRGRAPVAAAVGARLAQ